jgi:hypothetical protein
MRTSCFTVGCLLLLAARADPAAPPTAAETRALMKELLHAVRDLHLKQDPNSAQAGMVYEYVDLKKGKPGRWVQGEALDTMHDGAWLAAALAQAYRATGDRDYSDFLDRWSLPFYLKMLNHSDELFSPDRDDSCGKISFDKEHLLQKGEKGFVPYWWDDGASLSLEGRLRVGGKAAYPCHDDLAGQANPEARLSGYSLGCSNHMAQDLAVMLLAVWPLTAKAQPLARHREAVRDAARNLHASRLKHFGHIPATDAAFYAATGDDTARKNLPVPREGPPANEYTRIYQPDRPGQRVTTPGFADNQEYRYWTEVARTRGDLDRELAFQLVYDAFTLPQLHRAWSDNAAVPPGINRFDLAPIFARDGKFETYRSDRRVGGGSRMGPQNMVCCGRALQMLARWPGLWEDRYRQHFARDVRVRFVDGPLSLDDKPGAAFCEPVPLGKTKVALAADASALYLAGRWQGEQTTLELFERPDAAGKKVEVVLKKDGTVTATGPGAAALLCEHRVAAGADGTQFLLKIPFMIQKKQGPWWSAVEHGRYSLRCGDAVGNVYLASTEERVRDALRAELAGGLRTWERIFHDRGYVPTGLDNLHSVGPHKADDLSDTGGYAHLIAAGAQYLLYLDKQSDWQDGRPGSTEEKK